MYSRAGPGLPEVATIAGVAAVALVVGLAVAWGWPIAIAPGLVYLVALATAYLVYSRSRAVEGTATGRVEGAWPARAASVAEGAAFRVVGAHGTCPLGLGEGSVVTVGASGGVEPALCAPAQAVLRMAAGENGQVRQWCCPVYDHLLVFERAARAA